MTRFCCFGPGASADGAKAHRKGRRRRHKQPSTIPSPASNGTSANGLSGVHGSGGPMNGTGSHEIHLIDTPLNERTLDSDGEDFCSCRDDFSVTDGSHLDNAHLSPRGSVPQSPNNLKARSLSAADAQPDTSNQYQPAHLHLPSHPINQQQQAPDLQGASETETDSDIGGEGARRGFGCLHLLDSLNIGGNASTRHLEPQASSVKPSIGHGNKRGPGEKPEPGVSMQLRDMSQPGTDVSYCYQDASDSKFNLRGIDYMKTKVKVPSVPAMYQLFAADIFAMPKKQYHIAKYLNLPNHPPVMAGDVALPPVMIFNIQLPLYLATLFGPQDGEGVSIVFYFKLPEDFDPARFENQKALELFKRFVSNGREADGSPTRDRLKLIPRVVNVDEWIKKGPLSQAEAKILVSYNDKPILSRPQHMFYSGRGYMEVDLDCHQYTFLARRAISNYLARLPLVVWENAFVVQGNSPDELPEQLIGVARVYRFDFKQAKPLPSPVQREPVAAGTGTGTGQGETPASPTASMPSDSIAVTAS